MRSVIFVAYILLSFSTCYAWQTDSVLISKQLATSVDNISIKSLNAIDDKYSKLTGSIELQSKKLLKRMQDKEAKLQKKLQGIDSTKAKELFSSATSKYRELQAKLKSPVDQTISQPLKEYLPRIDSLQTLFKFLNQPNATIPGIPADKLQQIQVVSSQVKELQTRLQQANDIQSFIRERESQLKASLANMGFAKELVGYNKEVFYYQQRLTEYKAILHDKKKLEEKLLATVRNLPLFRDFMQKHSYLAFLFPVPANYGTPQALTGLQTRTNVQTTLMQRVSGSGTDPQQYVQGQMQQAQTQLSTLKDKINKLGGGSSDMTMPDFKPNNQHTKSFFQRLEYGFNMQSEKSRYLLPVTSDLAVTVGYKFSDKYVLGVGGSYKMGWGDSWNHIRFSSEGIGVRSYADMKFKGSIWLTGGFEYNYLQRFNDVQEIKNIDIWQRSALMGLSKKYKVGKKNGNMQVLYDFLAQKQVPQGQALKFRVGYTF